jgi:hypothetical protein
MYHHSGWQDETAWHFHLTLAATEEQQGARCAAKNFSARRDCNIWRRNSDSDQMQKLQKLREEKIAA